MKKTYTYKTRQANALKALRKARELISDPKRWYKGSLRWGRFDGDEWVTSYCALGAIGEALGHGGYPSEKNPAVIELGRALPDGWQNSIAVYNDRGDTSHGDILSAFDKAIVQLEAKVNA